MNVADVLIIAAVFAGIGLTFYGFARFVDSIVELAKTSLGDEPATPSLTYTVSGFDPDDVTVVVGNVGTSSELVDGPGVRVIDGERFYSAAYLDDHPHLRLVPPLELDAEQEEGARP